jgi:adenylate cyclase
VYGRGGLSTFSKPHPAAALTAVFVLVAFCWSAYLGRLQMEGVRSALDRFENLTVDWRFSFAGARAAPGGVVICAIDDEAIREAKAYPLPRSLLAHILRELTRLEPSTIALDIAFLDPGNPEADKELAGALRATKSVVAGIAKFGRSMGGGPQEEAREIALVPTPAAVLWPTPIVAEATRSGLVNVATDATGVPRFIPMLFRDHSSVIPSFALVAASLGLGVDPAFGEDIVKLGDVTSSLDLGSHLALRFYGPHGEIRQFSAARVLRGELKAEDVRGQIVLLGATALGLGDVFATPFDRVVSGVEVVATGITNLLHGDGLKRTPPIRTIDAATGMALAVGAVSLLAMRRTFFAIGLVCLLFLLWTALVFVAFLYGYWFSMAVPLAAALPVTVAYGAMRLGLDRYLATGVAKERAALAQFHSPLIVEHISKDPAFLERPVHQDVAAVFVDLSRFTAFAEELGPERAQELLGEFQVLIERDVALYDGVVAAFLGDGAMVIFGMPKPRKDDAARAFQAVMQLHRSTSQWLAKQTHGVKTPLRVRIGGHFGSAVISRLGSKRHQHITAIGDTINVSSRLLEVAKQFECSVVVSEELLEAANMTGSVTATALEVDIRGRARSMRVRTWS